MTEATVEVGLERQLAGVVNHLAQHMISAYNVGVAEPLEVEVVAAAEAIARLLYEQWPQGVRLAGSNTYFPQGETLVMVTDWGQYDLIRAREIRMPADVVLMFLADVGELLRALENPEPLTAAQKAAMQFSGLAIEELDLFARSYNCLKKARINSIGELIAKTAEELMAIPYFGKACLANVRQALSYFGLELSAEQPERSR